APTFRPAIRTLCDKVEFLSASTAGNARLPLFISVTERAAPLQGLHLFFGGGDKDEMEAATRAAAGLDSGEFLAFAAEDAGTQGAVALLREAPSVAGVAAEYQVLARAYENLVGEVMTLRDEWDYLQSRGWI